MVWSEVEAKAADRAWEGVARRIDPHHLSEARVRLREQGHISETTASTRGGRDIAVVHFTDLHRRQRTFADAAKRKRLLQARYLGWAIGTPGRPGLFGPGGERVLYHSLLDAARYGYRLVRPEGGPIADMFDEGVPVGPLDSAAYLQLVDEHGFPAGTIVVVIEVKNVRDWIYPRARELHQLLDKAAQLQLRHRDIRFVPVLVCRRTHYTTFAMAQDLGFHVLQTYTQFIQPRHDLNSAHLEEVRQELGYLDLLVHDTAHTSLTKGLAGSLLTAAPRRAERWSRTASAAGSIFAALRTTTSTTHRTQLLNELRSAAKIAGLYEHEGW